jgi:hypothetical protein
MGDEMQIWRSDDLGTLIREYTDASWQAVGEAVLEVLHEKMSPEKLVEMTPEELVQWGYAQGVGHLIMALLAREVRLGLIGRREWVQKQRRPVDHRPNIAPEN